MIFRNERLKSIPKALEKEAVVFSVLINIVLNSTPELTITDGDKYLTSYSNKPYPVFVWTKDGLDKADYEKIWNEAKKHFDVSNFSFCVKEELADYIIAKDGFKPELKLLSYECKEVIEPEKKVHGEVVLADESDIDELTQFTYDFQREVGFDLESYDDCRNRVKQKISNESYYMYKLDGNVSVAMAAIRSFYGMVKISHVYTLKSHRRKGYAERIVYELTKKILDSGYRAVLYTDSSYLPSNDCYIGVGYQYVGGFVRICK